MSVEAKKGERSAAFIASGLFTTATDGREGMECTAVMTIDGEEELLVALSALPIEGSKQMDYIFSLQAPSEEADITVMLSTGTYDEGIGFALDLFAYDGYDAVSAYLYYSGDKIEDEYGTALNGYVSLGVEAGEESFGFDTYLLLQATATDTTAWAYDSTGAVAIETLSENDAAAMQMGLMGVVGTAASAIMENVPGLAPIIASMMG